MKNIIYILILILISSCTTNKGWSGNAGKGSKGFKVKTQYCLRDFLTGEDSNGTWQVRIEPDGSDLTPLLIGDNPCINFATLPCGQYELMYIVGDPCCRDTATIKPLKCCLNGGYSTCEINY